MTIAEIILLVVFVLLVIRNIRVLFYRNKLVEEQIEIYDKLPDYHTMFIKFWIPLKNKYWVDKYK